MCVGMTWGSNAWIPGDIFIIYLWDSHTAGYSELGGLSCDLMRCVYCSNIPIGKKRWSRRNFSPVLQHLWSHFSGIYVLRCLWNLPNIPTAIPYSCFCLAIFTISNYVICSDSASSTSFLKHWYFLKWPLDFKKNNVFKLELFQLFLSRL